MSSSRFQAIGLITSALGTAAVLIALSSSFGAEPATTDLKRMEDWWVELEKGDTAATRALLKLSARPKETVAFLKIKLKPLTISSAQVKALLLKLGNANESVWKPAFEEIEYFDPRLAIDLKTLMDRYTETPARQRMVEVLSGREAGSLKDKNIQLRKFGGPDDFNFFAENEGSWWAEVRVDRISSLHWGTVKKKWTRAVRAIVLLEHIGTPDAAAILKNMATGHPDAYPTKVAKDSLKAIAARQSRASAGRNSHDRSNDSRPTRTLLPNRLKRKYRTAQSHQRPEKDHDRLAHGPDLGAVWFREQRQRGISGDRIGNEPDKNTDDAERI
jgi:hypothetical protein